MWPTCQGPSISLPKHQFLILYGSATPCLRRRSLHFVPFSTLQYSTRLAASSAEPVPKLRPMRGSVPTALHQVMNSLVPIWLVFVAFHALSSTRGRSCLGPTPSSQL